MKRVHLMLAIMTSGLVANAYAQKVEVTTAIQQDTLPSLQHANVHADGYQRWHFHPEHAIPLPYVPHGQEDGAVQASAGGPKAAQTLPSVSSIDGVGNGF